MEKLATKPQITCIKALINKLNINEDTAELMTKGFSGGRTTHVSSLYLDEAKYMIRHLKGLDPEEKKAEKMRRKIISLAHEMGWHLPQTQKINMKQLDGWCINYGMYHKSLNRHTIDELPQLVTQFEAVYKSYLETF